VGGGRHLENDQQRHHAHDDTQHGCAGFQAPGVKHHRTAQNNLERKRVEGGEDKCVGHSRRKGSLNGLIGRNLRLHAHGHGIGTQWLSIGSALSWNAPGTVESIQAGMQALADSNLDSKTSVQTAVVAPAAFFTPIRSKVSTAYRRAAACGLARVVLTTYAGSRNPASWYLVAIGRVFERDPAAERFSSINSSETHGGWPHSAGRFEADSRPSEARHDRSAGRLRSGWLLSAKRCQYHCKAGNASIGPAFC